MVHGYSSRICISGYHTDIQRYQKKKRTSTTSASYPQHRLPMRSGGSSKPPLPPSLHTRSTSEGYGSYDAETRERPVLSLADPVLSKIVDTRLTDIALMPEPF